MTCPRTHSQEMSGSEVDIFLQASQAKNSAYIWSSSLGDKLSLWVERLGLELESVGGNQYFHLGGSSEYCLHLLFK